MVSTSVKLALLSTFNMADANVAKAVFFHIVHSSFSSASVIFNIVYIWLIWPLMCSDHV
jgi:hypothetical protein